MAPPQRGRGSRARRGGRGVTRKQDDGVPDVYREMMREDAVAAVTAGDAVEGDRPRKRPRRAGEKGNHAEKIEPATATAPEVAVADNKGEVVQVASSPVPVEDWAPQTMEKEEDSDSELEFEDVQIGGSDREEEQEEEDTALPEPMKGQEEGFAVPVRAPAMHAASSRARRKRRPVTSAERTIRLAIHKMHILYLVYHVFHRNSWCNDQVAQALLKPMVPARVIQLLNPDPRASQAQSSSFFLLGLNQLADLFFGRFRVTALGMRRPQWIALEDLAGFQLNEASEKPMELSDFRRAARGFAGSSDLGAQLFCCVLRAVGVEARLVCSLQTLGWAAAAEAVGTPAKSATPAKKTLYLRDPEETPKAGGSDATKSTTTTTTPTPSRISRIGQPRANAAETISQASPHLTDKPPRVERPSYPVFWVEAFNAAHQKWIAVDPIATHTVNKPSRLEPGINDAKNSLTYVIAFEESGVARDVTRRYAKAFTAKTRRQRVESAEGGTTWLRRAMRLFSRPRALDRDVVEDAELTAKVAAEGMPKNVLDFKNHPIYALERHLRRNEIIQPMTESGRINVGTANQPKFESVYRRANVHIVKTADRWFRLGREIKIGEQPVKHALPRRGTRVRESPLDPENVEDIGVGMYAAFQTQVYIPPPVTDGRIPKNQYGNIDVYVPSMIPEGGVWIRMPEAKRAAKSLKIDYADAVTGFDFKGRHGTARVDGVVVAEEYHEAMEVVCEALRDATEEEREEDRRREALRLWRRFLVGMREVRRIEGYLRDDEGGGDEEMPDVELDEDMHDVGEEDGGGGGFVIDDGEREPSRPQRTRQRHTAVDDGDGGGFLIGSGDESEGGGGGGFVPEFSDDSGSGGGFVPEEETVTEDDIDDGERHDYGGGGFEPDSENEKGKSTAEANASADITGAAGEENEAISTTANSHPFGFANITIPTLSRVMVDTGHGSTSSLPTVMRGMRRTQLLTTTMADDDAEHSPSGNDKSTERVTDEKHESLDTAPPSRTTQLESGGLVDVASATGPEDGEPAPTTSKDTSRPEEPLEANSRSAEPVPTETTEQVKTPLPPAQAPREEPPVSSYEYDEDMLDEDPEDEDAEPEWLV